MGADFSPVSTRIEISFLNSINYIEYIAIQGIRLWDTEVTTSPPFVGLSLDARQALSLLRNRKPSKGGSNDSLHVDFLLIREHLSDDRDEDVHAHLVAAYAAGRLPGIGIVPEVDVFRSDPYLVARSLASLDILSGGRAGFAPFAEPRGVLDIGYATVGTDDAFIGEFIDVVGKLWNNWQPGALTRNWPENRYVDSSLIRRADHEGSHFQIRGPLPTPTAVQAVPFFFARAHPAHRAIVDRAAAVIVSADGVPSDHARTLIELPLNGLPTPAVRANTWGVLLQVAEEVSTWTELDELSAASAASLGWHPHAASRGLAARPIPKHVAQRNGATHV